ncbi:MAG: AtuA-related protein [Beijerinckiaceae bacterium]
MKLHEIATARAGDKGNTAQIAVIARKPEDYSKLCEALTTVVVAKAFTGIVHGPVTRHEVPGLHALVFLLEGALGGGVAISLAFDPHGKSLSSLMLSIELD